MEITVNDKVYDFKMNFGIIRKLGNKYKNENITEKMYNDITSQNVLKMIEYIMVMADIKSVDEAERFITDYLSDNRGTLNLSQFLVEVMEESGFTPVRGAAELLKEGLKSAENDLKKLREEVGEIISEKLLIPNEK